MGHKVQVSAVELRRHLSTLLDGAWQEPLMVTRYHMPWVWVLSDATWQQNHQQLLITLDNHPLRDIRKQVDAAFAREQTLTRRLVRVHRLSAPVQTVLRSLLLTLIYDFASTAELYDQIRHNRLFDWFVGSELSSDLNCNPDTLLADQQALLQDVGVVGLIDRLRMELPLDDLAAHSGLHLDHVFDSQWKARFGV